MPPKNFLTIEDVVNAIDKENGYQLMRQISDIHFNIEMKPRHAAVLIPIIEKDDGLHILYTRRAETLAEHRGQVSFPGGAWEVDDVDLIATALRETWEEIGLPPDKVQVLGYLSDRALVTGYLVTPVVGYIRQPFEICSFPEEVSAVFSIPLAWLADREHRSLEDFEYENAVHKVIYFKEYAGEILWGATARMTVDLLELLGY